VAEVKRGFGALFAVLATGLTIVVGAVTLSDTFYKTSAITDAAVMYQNPTVQNPFLTTETFSNCMLQEMSEDAHMYRYTGERGDASDMQKRCQNAVVNPIDASAYKGSVFLTNGGPVAMEDVRLVLRARNSRDEETTVSKEREYVAVDDRAAIHDLPIGFAPTRAVLCVSYESGLFRRHHVVFAGEPASASAGIVGAMASSFGALQSVSQGYSWFGTDGCASAVRNTAL
jgi:hypothetical protein